MTLDRRGLRVIQGSDTGNAAEPVERDFVVLEQRKLVGEQLKFAFWTSESSAERLLSIGIDGIDFGFFRRLLIEAGIRHVIDVRHLASFR